MKISIKNLSYSYSAFNDEKNAVKDISLEINSNKKNSHCWTYRFRKIYTFEIDKKDF